MLGDVAIRQMDIREEGLGLLVDMPPDGTHLRGIPKACAFALYFVFLLCSMDQIMARLTERDEIVGAITPRLARLDMMHIQDAVFGFALAPLAGMLVTEKHILTGIKEAHL